jgi:hypothetical protein
MQKRNFLSTVLLFVLILSSCTNSSSNSQATNPGTAISNESQTIPENKSVIEEKKVETNCDDDKRAYEFGREMATMVKLGSSSLKTAISDFSEPLGIEAPFNSSNPCVIKGFDDENNGVSSPYNKEGKNWTNF